MTTSKNYGSEMVRMVENRNHHLTILEYRNDIHNHLVQLDFELEESLQIKPLQDQVKILRSSILNSLLDVCFRLNWSSSTFSLAAHLFDTYTSKVNIEIINCRLIGFCCLWISSKYNENKPKGNILNALIKRSGYEQSAKPTFLNIEFDILKVINWDLSYPTPELFLDLFLNTGEPNNLERRLGSMFLCELSLFNLNIVSHYSSSSIAASSIMITNFAMLNLRHKHIRQHRFDELESLILNQVVKMEPSIKLKYLDSSIISHSNNNMVIHNLIYLSQCFVRQKEEEQQQLEKLKHMDLNPNLYYNSNGYLSNPSLTDNRNLSCLPISPMASPTNLPFSLSNSGVTGGNNSYMRTSYHENGKNGHSRSYSQSDDHYMDDPADQLTSTSGKRSRSHSLTTLRNILPTPGTTPTASFNRINSNSSSSSSSASNNNTTDTTNIELTQHNMKLMNKTPQIFTPVQLIPSALLYSHPHSHSHSHLFHPQLHSLSHPYSQRYDFNRLESPENLVTKRVRQKYQRTLPVLTRSKAKGFAFDTAEDDFSQKMKKRRL